MSETTEKRTRKSNSAKSVDETMVQDAPSAVESATPSTPKRKTRKSLPLDMEVSCVSAVPIGNLTYVSKRMQGLTLEWSEFGDEQSIELAELQAMRNSAPTFFEQNWILIDDDDVLKFLHADRYYSAIKSLDDFYAVLEMSPSQIAEVVPKLSNGLKRALSVIALKQYQEGVFDSISKMRALEMATGINIVST